MIFSPTKCKNKILSLFLFIAVIFYSCTSSEKKSSDPLAKASRENKNGWVYVHLEGSPADIGYQHGYLLADEIDTAIQTWAYLLQHDSNKEWQFFKQAARNFLWDKLEPEYKEEINGIAKGLQAQKKNYDSLDITALNAMEELAYYY